MYIMVRMVDNVIIGSSTKPICEKTCKDDGYNVFEIPDDEYDDNMIGVKLEGYEEDK